MGDAHSVQQKTAFSSTLTLIETTEDRNFGVIDIYRTIEAPYEYVMDFKKNFIEDNERVSRCLRLLGQLRAM